MTQRSPEGPAPQPDFQKYAGYTGPRDSTRSWYAADVLQALSEWVTDRDDKTLLQRTAQTLAANADANLEEQWPK